MSYTIVYSALDNGEQTAYGRFTTAAAADKQRLRMERDLDPDRDEAGGGVGDLQVVPLMTLRSWKEDNGG